jgi:hypothetical protein
VEQIVALDLNPDNVEQTRLRHSRRLRGLEPLCADIQFESLRYGPVDFTYAALLFEYVELRAALLTIRRNSRPNAALTTVLQLPHSTLPSVSTSPYTSLARLAPCMRLVAPEVLSNVALEVGFACADADGVELPSGKKFCVQNFTA